ncbi:MAG: TfoX/Sxy family protein [Chloroflexi bacterium]|nr:TfoX/Sxy family protein [Chloroflexota bacterium]
MLETNSEATKPVTDGVILKIPGVIEGKMFGYMGYKVNGKMFALLCGNGIAVKLPKERVASLLERSDAKPFEPKEGNVWKEWVLIEPADPNKLANEEALYLESVEYVTP